MKLVQILRPLFVVALGLHALVLFLPIGDDTVVIEDVEIEELSANDSTPAAKPSSPGTPPVPDPNVATAAAKPKTAPTAVASRRAPARPATNPRPAANSASSNANRSASSGSQGSTSNGSRSNGRTASNQSSSGQSSNNQSADSDSTQNQSSNSREDSTTSENQSQNGSTIPVLPAQESDTDEQPTANTEAKPSRASVLIAQVTRELPKSLRDFASKLDQSLTYNAENTDDESAQQAKEKWQADMQRQANVGSVEQMPPAEIAELTQIEYPIESSLKSEGRSLRRCLTEDPKTAEIGVRFDARGNIADEPRLLRSTGYSALNEEIKALVEAYNDFPSDRASKAFTFEVEVFYDTELCITAVELQK